TPGDSTPRDSTPGDSTLRDSTPGDDADAQHAAAGNVPVGRVSAAYRRPRMIVTVPLSALLGQPLATGAILGAGTPLAAEAARRMACDAEIIRLVTGPDPTAEDGHPDSYPGDPTGQLTDLLAAAIAQLPPPLAGPSAALDIGRKSP